MHYEFELTKSSTDDLIIVLNQRGDVVNRVSVSIVDSMLNNDSIVIIVTPLLNQGGENFYEELLQMLTSANSEFSPVLKMFKDVWTKTYLTVDTTRCPNIPAAYLFKLINARTEPIKVNINAPNDVYTLDCIPVNMITKQEIKSVAAELCENYKHGTPITTDKYFILYHKTMITQDEFIVKDVDEVTVSSFVAIENAKGDHWQYNIIEEVDAKKLFGECLNRSVDAKLKFHRIDRVPTDQYAPVGHNGQETQVVTYGDIVWIEPRLDLIINGTVVGTVNIKADTYKSIRCKNNIPMLILEFNCECKEYFYDVILNTLMYEIEKNGWKQFLNGIADVTSWLLTDTSKLICFDLNNYEVDYKGGINHYEENDYLYFEWNNILLMNHKIM